MPSEPRHRFKKIIRNSLVINVYLSNECVCGKLMFELVWYFGMLSKREIILKSSPMNKRPILIMSTYVFLWHAKVEKERRRKREE